MDLAEIKELIALMRKNKIQEIDLEQEGSKVRILSQRPSGGSKARSAEPAPAPGPYPMPSFFLAAAPAVGAAPVPASPNPAAEPAPPAEAKPAAPEAASEEEPSNLVEVKSPMVGTFYRAPAPDAPPYVEEGLTVGKDTVLCIIEAMKLMNEIKSDVHGRVVKALVENGQPVEFNQPLFLVEPV